MEGQPAGKLKSGLSYFTKVKKGAVNTKAPTGEVIGETEFYILFLFVPLLWQV